MELTARQALFSSATDMWETPQAFFAALDAEFHFDTDVCAVKENAKCRNFFSPEQDGLSVPWSGMCWCNPPYGREIGKWVKKAHDTAQAGTADVVMLLPARTDTRWFHEYIYGNAEIRFVKGRLKFGDSKAGAPFPSMVVIFRRME